MTAHIPNRVVIEIEEEVLFQELEGEMVLLDLKNGLYYGLDDVGARMWQLLTDGPDVETAVRALRAEYDVDEESLRTDLAALITRLLDAKLLKAVPRTLAKSP